MDTYDYMFHGSPDRKLFRQGESEECAEHGWTNCRRCEEGHIDRTQRLAFLPLSSSVDIYNRIAERIAKNKESTA